MCKMVTCSSCGRPTWAGCGAHVEQVLGDVPKADRCRCTAQERAPGSGASWLSRLLGRR